MRAGGFGSLQTSTPCLPPSSRAEMRRAEMRHFALHPVAQKCPGLWQAGG